MRKMLVSIVVFGIVFPCGLAWAEEPQQEETHTIPGSVDTKLPMGPILLGSMGAVLVVVGAGFGWQSYQENEDFNKEQNGVHTFATEDLADDIEKHTLAANILMFGGTAVVAASILWLLLDDDYKTETKGEAQGDLEAKWRPVLGPGRAGMTVEF